MSCLVADRDGESPIAGAKVRRDQGEEIAQTGADGRFAVDCHPEEVVSLRVDADGYVSMRWSCQASDATKSVLRLPLVRAATIAGRLLGDSGQGVPDAVALATNEAWDKGERQLPDGLLVQWGVPGRVHDLQPKAAHTRTGVDGRFELRVAADQTPYVILARHTDWPKATSPPITVARSEDRAEVAIRLLAVGTIVGRVTRGGQPLRREVRWRSLDSDAHGSEITDVDGSFRMRGVPPGRVVVQVPDPIGGANVLGEATIDVVAGKETRWDLALEELAGRIRGRVSGADGNPLPGVWVLASARQSHVQFSAETDDEGRYEVRCAADQTYRVWVRRDAFTDARHAVGAQATGVDFVLPECGLLRLQLVDAATSAPARVELDARATLAWRRSGAPTFQRTRHWFDTNGRVDLRLPQGRVDVSVSAPNSGFVTRVVDGLLVTGESTPPAISIALTRGVTWQIEVVRDPPFTRAARGDCLVFLLAESQLPMLRGPFAQQDNQSNHRYNGVHLWVEDPNILSQALDFGNLAVATLRGLAPGRYTLRVLPDEFAFAPRSIDVGTQDGRTELRWRRR